MKITEAFGHAETGSYYLVVESDLAQSYIDRLESLCSDWFIDPASQIVDAAILRNVQVGYLSETLAAAFSFRVSTTPLTAPAHAGGPPPADAPFETLCIYFAAHPDSRDAYDREIKAIDKSWKNGKDGRANGFVSSITAISIDVEDLDQWLVACIVCGYIWHPDKDNPAKDPRYDALLRILKPELSPVKKIDLERIKGNGDFPIIETKKLKRKDLPTDDSFWFDPKNERDPRSPMRLALSFAGYEFLDLRLFDLLTTVEQIAFDGQPRVLECFNTTGLRLLLFGLQRRSHNADTGLETDALTRAIIAQLRARLAP